VKYDERLTMKRSIHAIILAGLVVSAGFGFAVLSMSRPAPVDADAMTAANELVAAGHYAEAAQMYEQMIARGPQDAALYYNLGNATLALGDAGRAVVAYEQAAALAPRDADIQFNLALAQQQARGPVNRPSASRPGGLADLTGRWLTVDELALLALSAWLAFGLLILAYRGLKPQRSAAAVRATVVIAFLVVLATSGALASRMAAPRLAAPPTTAGQPPAENGGQQAAIPTGVCLQSWSGCVNPTS
jgi:Tetratricopeptide repeat